MLFLQFNVVCLLLCMTKHVTCNSPGCFLVDLLFISKQLSIVLF